MAKPYPHTADLAMKIGARRLERMLSYEKLGMLSGVDVAQTFRICRGDFRTLNPSVLRICKVLSVEPLADGVALRPVGDTAAEVMLSSEVLLAWDRTEAGAELLKRVLRALHGVHSN